MVFPRLAALSISFFLWASLASAQVETKPEALAIEENVRALARAGDPVVQIDAGTYHACAVVQSGHVYCWGWNAFGQLGDGTLETSARPVRVTMLSDVKQIDAGGSTTCALLNSGQVFCWGAGENGQLGHGAFEDSATPVRVRIGGNPVQVSVGFGHTCLLKENGRAFCWGLNRNGQLGIGEDSNEYNTPQRLVGDRRYTNISAGAGYTCAVAENGRGYCWGENVSRRLGIRDNSVQDAREPTPVMTVRRLTQIGTGLFHTCALREDGIVYCWGDANECQVGPGICNLSRDPTIVRRLFDAKEISLGSKHTCALRENGWVACWGRNRRGQLGDGAASKLPRAQPERVIRLRRLTDVSLGRDYSCALRDDGKVFCWGGNGRGELGNGEQTLDRNPIRTRVKFPRR